MLLGIEIEKLQGVREGLRKMYAGTANDQRYNVFVLYERNRLEMRVSEGGDPRTGIVLIDVMVPDAPPHDINDERMIHVLETNGVLFKGKQRVVIAAKA